MRVMGFGTFDGLHPGHLDYLKQLRALGDELFVVVARDSNVERIKGKVPKQSEQQRVEGVERSQLADKVILGNADDLYQVLHDYRPDVIGLGYDQPANEEAIKKAIPGVKVVRLKPFRPDTYKSSILSKESMPNGRQA